MLRNRMPLINNVNFTKSRLITDFNCLEAFEFASRPPIAAVTAALFKLQSRRLESKCQMRNFGSNKMDTTAINKIS